MNALSLNRHLQLERCLLPLKIRKTCRILYEILRVRFHEDCLLSGYR